MKSYSFILLCFGVFLISCHTDLEVFYTDTFHPDQAQFKSSVFVEVVTASGQPVANTTIRIGNLKGETDVQGLLYLNDVLVGASTYLVAEKEGYFHASRRFYPAKGSQQYI